jgi:hypothetical protein
LCGPLKVVCKAPEFCIISENEVKNCQK